MEQNAENKPPTVEERLSALENALVAVIQHQTTTLNLLNTLGSTLGMQIDLRQVDGGRQLARWKQESGRILVP